MPKTAARDIKKGMTFVFFDALCVALSDAYVTTTGEYLISYRDDTTGGLVQHLFQGSKEFFAHSRPAHAVNVHTDSVGYWRHVCPCGIWAPGYAHAQEAVNASRELHANTNDTITPTIVGPRPTIIVQEHHRTV